MNYWGMPAHIEEIELRFEDAEYTKYPVPQNIIKLGKILTLNEAESAVKNLFLSRAYKIHGKIVSAQFIYSIMAPNELNEKATKKIIVTYNFEDDDRIYFIVDSSCRVLATNSPDIPGHEGDEDPK